MRIVVDANILIGEILRVRGRKLIEHDGLQLFATERAWSETQHELEKRLGKMAAHNNQTPTRTQELLDSSLELILTKVEIVPDAEHAHLQTIAERRIPRDLDDAPTVAIALLLEADI